jgi:hypothetical protein
VPYDDNEAGSYIRSFKVPSSFQDHQLRLKFEGVDSAFHVWINGEHVGYSQGSRNPSEFDVTSLVDVHGENKLAVQVYQFCDGSYIEDQVSLFNFGCAVETQISFYDMACSLHFTGINGGSVESFEMSSCSHFPKLTLKISKFRHG